MVLTKQGLTTHSLFYDEQGKPVNHHSWCGCAKLGRRDAVRAMGLQTTSRGAVLLPRISTLTTFAPSIGGKSVCGSTTARLTSRVTASPLFSPRGRVWRTS